VLVVFFHCIVACTRSYGARAYIDVSTTIDTTSSPDINDLKLTHSDLVLQCGGVVIDDLTRQPPRVARGSSCWDNAAMFWLGTAFASSQPFPTVAQYEESRFGAALVLLHFVLLLYTLFFALVSLKFASES
jgi:hypothetical protein